MGIHDEDFMPNQLPLAWDKIDAQLILVEKKLKKTSAYLRRILTGGYPMWWYVDVRLKDISDEGKTNIYLTFEKTQIAANVQNVIQIDRAAFESLDLDSKISLIMHEAMWTAVGPQYVGKGDNIRKLTRLLMNPAIGNYPAAVLGNYIKQFVGTDKSPLSILASIDVEELAVKPKLDVSEVVSDLGPQPLVTVIAPSPIKGLMVSGFKANPHYAHIAYVKGYWNCLNAPSTSQENCTLANDLAIDGETPRVEKVIPSELCGGMNYAGYSDWRIATTEEITALQRLGLFGIKFPQNLTMRHRLTSPNPIKIGDLEYFTKIDDISVASQPFLYPANPGQYGSTFILAPAKSGQIYLLSTSLEYGPTKIFRNTWPRPGSGNPPEQIWHYLEYLCVRR